MFAAADLSSCSSYDSAKYKLAWIKAKLIRFPILYAQECPDACSRALYIAPNNKEFTSLWLVTGAIYPKKHANAITQHEQNKKYCPMKHQSVIN